MWPWYLCTWHKVENSTLLPQSLFIWHAFNYALTLNFLGVANIISVCIMIIIIFIMIIIVDVVVEVYFNCQPQRRLFAPAMALPMYMCLPGLFRCFLFIYLRSGSAG